MDRFLTIPLLCLSFLAALNSAHIDSVSVGVDSASKTSKHQEFVPLVAFQCGYKNRYLDSAGKWISDSDKYATCLTGKLDILKYCRKVYPSLDITNIVEYSHHQTLHDWCKEGDATKCKWQFTVQPYQCIVGEFRGEALHVPNGCRFGHVDERQTCDDFAHWHNQAIDECGRRLGADGRTTRLHSFAMLEPCGLDLFSGVEFVCCPQEQAPSGGQVDHQSEAGVGKKSVKYGQEKVVKSEDKKLPLPKSAAIAESDLKPTQSNAGIKADLQPDSGPAEPDEDVSWAQDEDDDDYWSEDGEEDDEWDESYEDEEDDDDLDATTEIPKTVVQKKTVPEETDDPYFMLADPDNEHAMYREALDRLDQKHRDRIAKVMREWAELENRYVKMKETDPKYADKFKQETRERFQKTVKALSMEIDDQRKQIKRVHQERVLASINLHKKDAMLEFRSALANAMSQPADAQAALHSLERYIRAEEKDRIHTLKQYRHAFKKDPSEARESKPEILRRLRDIDARINGTFSLLKDFPELEKKIMPVALGYWRDFRHANTPFTEDPLATSLGGEGKDEHLLAMYEHQVDTNDGSDSVKNLPADLKETLDAFRVLEPVSSIVENPEIVQSAEKKDEVLGQEPSFHFRRVDAHLAEEGTHHDSHHVGDGHDHAAHGLGMYVALVAMAMVAVVAAVAVVHRRRRHQRERMGFIEVDLYTPEERQVAAMQCNGYENPTYAYFER